MRARHLPALTALLATTGCATHAGYVDPRSTTTAVTTVSPSRLGPAVITACGPGATATITITNPATGTASFRVSILFLDQAGTPVTTGTLDPADLAPGETRTGTVTAEEPDTATTQCAIGRVDPL